MGKVFEYSVIVREHNLDTLGHLNNASYLQLFEEARWDFSDKGGFGLDWVLSNKQSPIVLKAEMSFRKEVLSAGQVGTGLHIVVADLNKDGWKDIVVPGKSGTHILWSKGKS